MSILFELRYPTKWYTKLFTAVVALIFFAGLATLVIAGFLVYRIVKPTRTSTDINMNTFPGRPDSVQFEVPGPMGHRGRWFRLCRTINTTYSCLILRATARMAGRLHLAIAKPRS